MATFITSKLIGEIININVQTSTGYWKYNHDGSDSSVFENGYQTITLANANGEFTILPCDSEGNVSGDVTLLNLEDNQLTSFDGTGLSSLTQLFLITNQLTSFDATGLGSLALLDLGTNQLTSFDATGLSSLQVLYLNSNQLTSSSNNQILYQLNQNGLSDGSFASSNGRTSASNTDYDNLLNKGWSFDGLDLITPPVVGSGKLRVKGVTTGGDSSAELIAALMLQIQTIEIQIQDYNTLISQNQDGAVSYQNVITDRQTQIDTLTAQITQLTSDISELNSTIASLQSQLSTANADKANYIASAGKKPDQTIIDGYDATIASLQNQINAANADKANKTDSKAAKTNQKSVAQGELSEAQSSLAVSQESLLSYNDSLSIAQNSLTTAQQELAVLQG